MGSGNGLVLNRRQAIAWTNDGPVHWRIYAALGGGELRPINGPRLTSFQEDWQLFEDVLVILCLSWSLNHCTTSNSSSLSLNTCSHAFSERNCLNLESNFTQVYSKLMVAKRTVGCTDVLEHDYGYGTIMHISMGSCKKDVTPLLKSMG